jgi:hypothetical protein
MPHQPAYRLPRNVRAARALALYAVIAVTAWSGGPHLALSADNSAWLGRWSIAAETCQNDGYDMLIEPDHFEIWEQACDIKKWSINGNLATSRCNASMKATPLHRSVSSFCCAKILSRSSPALTSPLEPWSGASETF